MGNNRIGMERCSAGPGLMLNDGTGWGFRSIPIPQATEGDGDMATPIPGLARVRASCLPGHQRPPTRTNSTDRVQW